LTGEDDNFADDEADDEAEDEADDEADDDEVSPTILDKDKVVGH
jgi:hypothetical protein